MRDQPTVGAVIPCKNEGPHIERCLTALRAQRPAIFPVVVVDNGSTDGSLETARKLADQVLEIPTGSISSLRNAGAVACRPVAVLAFVDADTEVDEGWLNAGLRELKAGAALVGSRTRAGVGTGWVARRWAAIEAGRAHAGSRVWSQHLLIRAETFRAVGGFPEIATGEDAALSMQVEQLGSVVRLVPDMGATHHGFPEDLSAFLRRERWHTRASGWFPRMSRGSQSLVAAGALWAAAGAVTGVDAVWHRRERRLVAWMAASLLAVPALGLTSSRQPAAVLQDGLLMTIWASVRVLRLPRELRRRRSA